jgi:hypothetical protein
MRVREAQGILAQARQGLAETHTSHAGDLAKLTALNQAASEQARLRASLEQQVAKLEALEQRRVELHAELKTLFEPRSSLNTDHILMRDQVSTMRDEVASELQHQAGERVRIRVMRNADHMSYQQMLVDGLKGARVRNQNEILETGAASTAHSIQRHRFVRGFDAFRVGAFAEDTRCVSGEKG